MVEKTNPIRELQDELENLSDEDFLAQLAEILDLDLEINGECSDLSGLSLEELFLLAETIEEIKGQ